VGLSVVTVILLIIGVGGSFVQQSTTFLSNTFDNSTDDWAFYSIYIHTTWPYKSAEDKFSMQLDHFNGDPGPSIELTGSAIDYAGCASKSIDVSEVGYGRLKLSFDFESTSPSTNATFPTVLLIRDEDGSILFKENVVNFKAGWNHYQGDLTTAVANMNTVRIAICIQDSDAHNISKSIWFDNIKLQSEFV
jgi:hypothetical protein